MCQVCDLASRPVSFSLALAPETGLSTQLQLGWGSVTSLVSNSEILLPASHVLRLKSTPPYPAQSLILKFS